MPSCARSRFRRGRGNSLSWLVDSSDKLGDALVYASSLYVMHKSSRAQAGAALLKGIVMLAFAVRVFAKASYQFFLGSAPEAPPWGQLGAWP